MAKDFAKTFYKSQAWKRCRAAYIKKVGGWCESCLARGNYMPAEIVHHTVHITEENINDPNITLSFNKLKAVCRACHAEEHGAKQKRYSIDGNGTVLAKR